MRFLLRSAMAFNLLSAAVVFLEGYLGVGFLLLAIAAALHASQSWASPLPEAETREAPSTPQTVPALRG
ncbi:hypothetical protein [Roseomonas elaeocarpi]|uniref:Uncharacterized protein n=1 Tax=Roseomonas elaeocarpi TaxID=907779 RepID=A0ABV6JYJ2_9PROT